MGSPHQISLAPFSFGELFCFSGLRQVSLLWFQMEQVLEAGPDVSNGCFMMEQSIHSSMTWISEAKNPQPSATI